MRCTYCGCEASLVWVGGTPFGSTLAAFYCPACGAILYACDDEGDPMFGFLLMLRDRLLSEGEDSGRRCRWCGEAMRLAWRGRTPTGGEMSAYVCPRCHSARYGGSYLERFSSVLPAPQGQRVL